jgi:methyltransferase-like protein
MKEKKLMVNPDVVFREEENEALVFDPKTGKIVILNPTAKYIWQLCNGKNTQEEIIKCIIEKYDVTIEKAKEDIIKFINTMKEKGLIGEIEEL